MYNLFLIIVAIIPAVVLCVYVYKKDRIEKEPLTLLLKLLLLGALCCYPAAIIENILFDVISKLLFWNITLNYLFTRSAYIIIHNFFVVALVEEGCKYFVLNKVTRKNREFNSLFDGIIYAVFVSLGFAAFENVFYVIENGITVGIMRAVLSVPGHMFFAVMMGYFYSRSHIKDKASMLEISLIKRGIISYNKPLFNSKKERLLTLVIPIILHGTYNSCCSIGTTFSTLLLVTLVIFMYVYCFGKILKVSKNDTYENSYIMYMMTSKYPELSVNDQQVKQTNDIEENIKI